VLSSAEDYKSTVQPLLVFLSRKSKVQPDEWSFHYRFFQKQHDAKSCGVFACYFAKCLILGIDIERLTDFQGMRQRILYEIVYGRLIPY
jgi:hypothetical protein